MLLLLALACSSADPAADGSDAQQDTDAPPDPWEQPPGDVITLETRDGVMLEADYVPADAQGAPGVILLHMIPPGNDRTNWPDDFVTALADKGWSVIRLDRRGAGGSEGIALEAYEGPDGKKDVEAAALRLQDDGYGDLVVLGASNGTTSMLDYTVWAPGQGLPEPVALGFMTGGAYTENQSSMDELLTMGADAPPSVFTYSTAEAGWSLVQEDREIGDWQFHEYPGGDHGTRMFDSKPEVATDLLDFLVDILGA